MVGTDGYAPSTFPMSMEHSTNELSPLSHDPRLSHSEVIIKTIFFYYFFRLSFTGLAMSVLGVLTF